MNWADLDWHSWHLLGASLVFLVFLPSPKWFGCLYPEFVIFRRALFFWSLLASCSSWSNPISPSLPSGRILRMWSTFTLLAGKGFTRIVRFLCGFILLSSWLQGETECRSEQSGARDRLNRVEERGDRARIDRRRIVRCVIGVCECCECEERVEGGEMIKIDGSQTMESVIVSLLQLVSKAMRPGLTGDGRSR